MQKSYSEVVSDRMKTAPGGPLSIREVARQIGYSYEHVRKLLNGEKLQISKEANDAICSFLGLNAEQMWKRARLEMAQSRWDLSTRDVYPPPDTRMRQIWPALSQQDREYLVRIAKALVP